MKKKELQDVWDKAVTPKAEDLKGEYRVKMLTGPFLFLNVPGDTKYFCLCGANHGFNILGKNKDWGFFFLEDAPGQIVINYNEKANGKTVRRIRDHIRYVPNCGYYIGKFNMVISGKLRFLGWFTLTKIQKEG